MSSFLGTKGFRWYFKKLMVWRLNMIWDETKLKVTNDVAPNIACKPLIFFINRVLYFFKINDNKMEKEER